MRESGREPVIQAVDITIPKSVVMLAEPFELPAQMAVAVAERTRTLKSEIEQHDLGYEYDRAKVAVAKGDAVSASIRAAAYYPELEAGARDHFAFPNTQNIDAKTNYVRLLSATEQIELTSRMVEFCENAADYQTLESVVEDSNYLHNLLIHIATESNRLFITRRLIDSVKVKQRTTIPDVEHFIGVLNGCVTEMNKARADMIKHFDELARTFMDEVATEIQEAGGALPAERVKALRDLITGFVGIVNQRELPSGDTHHDWMRNEFRKPAFLSDQVTKDLLKLKIPRAAAV